MIGGMRRTKIVATIGPASSSREMLRRLFDAGLDVARVTLAHGTVEGQKAIVSTIRAEADAVGRPVGILVDLPGPKVRTTSFSGEVLLQRDDRVTLVAGRTEPSTASTLVVDYPTLVEDLRPGDVVRIGDGAVQLEVEARGTASLSARVLHGGQLTGRKGFRIPTARLRATEDA